METTQSAAHFMDHMMIKLVDVPARMMSPPSDSRQQTAPHLPGMAKFFTGSSGLAIAQSATWPVRVPARTTCLERPYPVRHITVDGLCSNQKEVKGESCCGCSHPTATMAEVNGKPDNTRAVTCG